MKNKIIGIFVCIQFFMIIIFPSTAITQEDTKNYDLSKEEPTMINYMKLWGSKITSFSEYSKQYNIEPFEVQRVYPKNSLNVVFNSNLVYIFVPESIYENISFELFQYSNDLDLLGLSTEIYAGSWGTPQDVRSFMQQLYTKNTIGFLFVGDIPTAWYEQEAFEEHEEFPIDLYYMDLNGTWYDTDNNGIYDGISRYKEPEVWVGRLKADVLSGDECELLRNYFKKCHNYRTKSLVLPHRALVYIDDDWVDDWGTNWNNEVKYAYSDRTYLFDKYTTESNDYKNQLNGNYEMVHLAVHSGPARHHFKNPDGWSGTVSSDEIKILDPHAFFYNLYACSAARYIEQNYIAGWYIFTDTYGLLAIGSTKTGGMYISTLLYDLLGKGSSFGEAFKEWFISQGIKKPDYFYGLTIIGDPTLPLTINQLPENDPPNKPLKPSGNISGITGEYYNYTTNTSDPDGNQMWFQWDWGDGNYSNWLGPYNNHETCEVNHNWTVKGEYSIKVKVKDIFGSESDWSDPLSITMPYSYEKPIPQFLELLFQRFPNSFPLLRHLMGS